jgi:hypothetical protein
MRYYFHLRIGGTISPDEIGVDLPDVETAYLEAFKAAEEMWSELLAEGLDPLMRSFPPPQVPCGTARGRPQRGWACGA